MLNESGRQTLIAPTDLLARWSIRIDIFRELLSIVTADVKGLTRVRRRRPEYGIRGRESGRDCICLYTRV